MFSEFECEDGQSRSLDMSSEATSPFGFVFQQRVRTPRGPAEVLGVYHGKRVFYSLESRKDPNKVIGVEFSKKELAEYGPIRPMSELPVKEVDTGDVHRLKTIEFNGRRVRVVLQGPNGPCPVLALSNALILRGDFVNATADVGKVIRADALRERLCDFLANNDFPPPVFVSPEPVRDDPSIRTLAQVLFGIQPKQPPAKDPKEEKENNAAEEDVKGDADDADRSEAEEGGTETKRDDAAPVENQPRSECLSATSCLDEIRMNLHVHGREQLEKLYSGLDVSPLFSHVDGFDGDGKDILLFPYAGVRLLHGWIIPGPDSEDNFSGSTRILNQFAPLQKKSFNEVVVIATDSTNALYTVASQFLEQTRCQMTSYGLGVILNELSEGDIAVLFWNNHFSTIVKRNNRLLSLLSDESYADKRLIAFEVIQDRHGNGTFVNGRGEEVDEIMLAVDAITRSEYSEQEMMCARELLYRREEFNPSAERIVEILKTHLKKIREELEAHRPSIAAATTTCESDRLEARSHARGVVPEEHTDPHRIFVGKVIQSNSKSESQSSNVGVACPAETEEANTEQGISAVEKEEPIFRAAGVRSISNSNPTEETAADHYHSSLNNSAELGTGTRSDQENVSQGRQSKKALISPLPDGDEKKAHSKPGDA